MIDVNTFDMGKDIDIQWCPGCGNFGILRIMKTTLAELDLKSKNVIFVSGIGQAAKFPQYLKCHYFNGLHGRSLPAALAIKAANPEMTVICESGDGCSYGEGGNHFVHTILRNPDITNIVHNNMVYGLTKGQASPTSQYGFMTPVQVSGVTNEPFNPLAIAIALEASFVARVYVGNPEHAKEVFKEAIQHKGYALVDVFQPCVTYNKINTYQWFKSNTYIMEDHDPTDKEAAFKLSTEKKDKLPLGIFYKNPKPTFEDLNDGYANYKEPLYKRKFDIEKLATLISSKRTL
ncbi:MAG: thiamine pyrophosphate-dependent enzyme [Candidatus Odinarchaeota archaeon]